MIIDPREQIKALVASTSLYSDQEAMMTQEQTFQIIFGLLSFQSTRQGTIAANYAFENLANVIGRGLLTDLIAKLDWNDAFAARQKKREEASNADPEVPQAISAFEQESQEILKGNRDLYDKWMKENPVVFEIHTDKERAEIVRAKDIPDIVAEEAWEYFDGSDMKEAIAAAIRAWPGFKLHYDYKGVPVDIVVPLPKCKKAKQGE